MKDDLIKGLAGLGLKNAQIEKDLQLPLNSLSAVLNGKKRMPDKWCAKVREYLLLKNPPPPKEDPKPIKDPTRPWIEEIEQYCRQNGFYPDFLIEFHRTHSNSAAVKAIEGLKKALAPERGTETRKAVNPGLKNREMFEPEEGTNAYFVRYGAFYKKDIPK
jgi:hypothetical protein